MSLRSHPIILGFTVAALFGCVGTVDSVHSVQGDAPGSGECNVTVTKGDSSNVIASETVRESFSVYYGAAGPFPSSVDITARCNGVIVKELKAVSPRSSGNIQLGTLAP